ncbi:hypothetical protein [Chitinivorax sp. B]|uniref:hypothetical protein n=1 Tax=Chitinivorax sp. B TaxID=2502235 RepID=UPI0010F97B59|nr:hypothetical protein [Chitinivorax sp. B]
MIKKPPFVVLSKISDQIARLETEVAVASPTLANVYNDLQCQIDVVVANLEPLQTISGHIEIVERSMETILDFLSSSGDKSISAANVYSLLEPLHAKIHQQGEQLRKIV